MQSVEMKAVKYFPVFTSCFGPGESRWSPPIISAYPPFPADLPRVLRDVTDPRVRTPGDDNETFCGTERESVSSDRESGSMVPPGV